MEKRIHIHHLYYTIAIAIIIFIAFVLIVPDRVSENAFENFSFASTITSIVLAVVSIVYSIYAGNASSAQLNNVREIDAEIKKQLDGFGHIEENVSKLLDGGMSKLQDDVKKLSDGQTQITNKINDLGKNVESKNDASGNATLSFADNSTFGDLLLYACALSNEKSKPLPKEIFDEEIADYNYWFGYLVALQMSLPDKIKLSSHNEGGTPLSALVIKFDTAVFGTASSLKAKLSAHIKEGSSDSIKKYLNDVDTYYNVNDSAN